MLRSQTATGEIRLEVKDPSGQPVQASGKLTNPTVGEDRVFETDIQGARVETSLPFGRYRLEVSKPGFATQSVLLNVQSVTPVSRTVTLSLSNTAFSVDVVGTTPLPGVDLSLDEIPAPVQRVTDRDFEQTAALGLSDLLNRRLNSVYMNEVQGNPVQPDLSYRGYTASPLLGTPQGVSVYMDGVRLNQPFGDVVSWDLIPRIAISDTTLMPGSNPLFGLNTLGGALSIQTKDGRNKPGTAVQLSGGSFGRLMGDFEHGGANSKGLSWYLAANLFFEDGWRETSPSNVRQFFGKVGYQRGKTFIGLTVAYANNSLNGNGPQEQRFLDRTYSSVYTKPDITANRSPLANFRIQHAATRSILLSGNVYYRYIRTNTYNGDINEDSLDQSLYQPNAAERAALAAAGYTGFPTSGENATNTPFPFWRCIANALRLDEPAEKCNGLINQTHSQQRNYGLSGQMTWFANPGSTSLGRNRNQFTLGGAYDRNSVDFAQSSELGYLNPDRSITGVGAFGDGVTGGDVDGEPYDTRVNLHGNISTGSFFVTDTFSFGNRWHLTGSGRYNRTTVDNYDRIRPIPGPGSLSSVNVFDRFNPAAGITFNATRSLNTYFNYSEGSRAPTSIELGCADPNQPCKLPNAMAGDPPLEQVVARTYEAGVRGIGEGNLRWNAGWFLAENTNDILFVAAPQTGFGYFKNFGKTRRQGLELGADLRVKRVSFGSGYTFMRATFQSPEQLGGTGNSTNEAAEAGVPGVDGTISIQPGNRIPLIPEQMFKAYADYQATSKLALDLGLIAFSSAYARGNENNDHQPDGTYYLGPGVSPAYAVVSLGARYQATKRLQLFVQINNLFNTHYYSAAQLGPTGFTSTGNFIARPFPAIAGEFPVQQATFFAPGAPIGAWGGVRWRF